MYTFKLCPSHHVLYFTQCILSEWMYVFFFFYKKIQDKQQQGFLNSIQASPNTLLKKKPYAHKQQWRATMMEPGRFPLEVHTTIVVP